MADTKAINTAVRVLNRALDSDRDAIESLMANRVYCNDALADDETIQAGAVTGVVGRKFSVGMLGLVNGLFGIKPDGMGYICAVYSIRCQEDGEVEDFLSEQEAKGLTMGDKCPRCGYLLGLGHIVRFGAT